MLFSDSEKPNLTLDFQVHSCSEVISISDSGSGLGELPRSEKISDGLNIVGLGAGMPYNRQIEPLWPDTKIVSKSYPQVVFSISGFKYPEFSKFLANPDGVEGARKCW